MLARSAGVVARRRASASRCRSQAGGTVGDARAIALQFRHFSGDLPHVGLQFVGCGRIGHARDVPGNREARVVPRDVAGTPIGVPEILAPAVFRACQAVMAGKAIELGVLRPGGARRAPRASADALQAFAKLNDLADAPVPDVLPGIGLLRRLPVPRHRGAEGLEIENQIRVARGDHFVVDRLLGGTDVARRTFLGPFHHIFRVVHPELD